MGFLHVLKIIGIVIGCLILFIIAAVAIILSSPIFYKGKITYKDDLLIKIKVCHIFRFVYGFINYENDDLDYYIRVLWEKIDDDEDEAARQKKKLKKAKRKAKKRRKRELKRMKAAKSTENPTKTPDSDIKPPLVETKQEKQEKQPEKETERTERYKNFQNGNKNKKSIFKRIKSIYNGIKHKIIYYIDNLKEILAQVNDRENREAVVYALKMIKQPVSFILNEKLKVRMKLGTDDPANTGEILGIAYAAAALLGVDLVIEPDFENKIFELDAGFKGHVSVFKVIVWVLELYSNDKIKVVVDDVL